MPNSNAIIAIVTLFIMCVPGAWFAIRVLGPRFLLWRTRRDRRRGILRGLPLHHPLPSVLELPVLGSSAHPVHTFTIPSSATISFVGIVELHPDSQSVQYVLMLVVTFLGPSGDS
ncbi:hypothetical protein F5883DRAFT_584352 [Diaporthe sp. PMI_573]|nr:hypothetical protein F5883DRAFT_584352 [Diaporthaceae sp. PMI_573]